MKIAIIGAGNVGTTLAGGWRKAGHDIVFGVRNPVGKKAELAALGDVASTKDAAARADPIVIAVPWTGIDDVTSELAAAAAGKTVIDVTNPIAPPYTDLAVTGSDSGAERVARNLKQSRVVKAHHRRGGHGQSALSRRRSRSPAISASNRSTPVRFRWPATSSRSPCCGSSLP